MSYKDKTQKVDINIKGINELKLVATNGGDDISIMTMLTGLMRN